MKPQRRMEKPSRVYLFLFFALLFTLQVFPRLGTDSPTSDEPVDITDGFYYWKGDVLSDSRHPPLAKALQAAPLWAMGLRSKTNADFKLYERRDFNFLFVLNRERFQSAVAAARFVTLLFGLGIGWLLFSVARQRSAVFLAAVMVLWAFAPNLLAFSGLALADIPLAFFFLAAVMAFQKLTAKSGWRAEAGTGVLTAMAVTAKFSAVILLPVFAVLEFWRWKQKPVGFSVLARRWGVGLLAALGWISLLYLPGTLLIPDHRFPLAYFWSGFTDMLSFSGHPTYFLGELSLRNHLLYYPAAFVLKSPLSFLLFLLAAAGLAAGGKLKIPAWQWFPACALFAAILPFHNIGIREILPVFPFFILVAASGAEGFWRLKMKSRAAKMAVAGLLAVQAVNVALSFPAHISYFNPLVPSDRRMALLGDSNLDIGQDTQRLAQTAAQRGWTHVKLAYFGITDPSLYGMSWTYWTAKDLTGPQPGWVYAVNSAFLQLGPVFMPESSAIGQSWITRVPPTGQAGDTWYFFEIPGKVSQNDTSAVLPSASNYRRWEKVKQ